MRSKFRMLITLISIMGLLLPRPVQGAEWSATYYAGAPVYTVNGQSYQMDVPPLTIRGRTYLPIRWVAYGLGIQDSGIQWDAKSRSVQLSKGMTDVTFQVGNSFYWVNGESKRMDVAPFIDQNRLYLPIRYAAEALGADVYWDTYNRSIIITFAGVSLPPEQETIQYHYQWSYNGSNWDWMLKYSAENVASLLDFYRSKPHPHRGQPDYLLTYCLDEDDNPIITTYINKFEETAEKHDFNEYELAEFVIAFVQGLQYTTDSVTTGYDEYPRYPLETLFEQGGDCEDTSILAATFLRELGFGCALLIFPDHCALGVYGAESIPGAYYLYEDRRYYYLETTENDWPIGVVPDEYQGKKAIIIPVP